MVRTLLLFISLLSLPSVAATAVTFNVSGHLYTFDQPVRLATLLSIVRDKPTSYWANAVIYQLEDPQVEQLRSNVLQQLAMLIREQSKGSAAYHQLSALYQQIGSWQLMRRLDVLVDYDQARLYPGRNPQFNSGEYYIRLHKRPETIQVSGMVSAAIILPFDSKQTVTDYIDAVERSANAHRDIAYLLEPDGDIKKLGIAYWNRQHVKPMPGSEIFVPLQDELFFDRIGELNDNIAQLMMHRM